MEKLITYINDQKLNEYIKTVVQFFEANNFNDSTMALKKRIQRE